jgi:hypothetical protein
MDFAGGLSFAEHLADKVTAAAQAQLFSQHAQGAVGGDEVYRLYPGIALDREQEMAQK